MALSESLKAAQKRYNEKHPARRKAQYKKWATSPQGVEWRRKYMKEYDLQRNYNMSKDTWDKMVTEQNGKCAICFNPPSDGEIFAVDHNHTTKKVGALLCRKCNLMLGYSGDSALILEEAARYLKRF